MNMYLALALFALTYVLILAFSKYRTYIALGSGLIFLLSGMLSLGNVGEAIDFNVLLMIAGSMGLVQLFIDSKMPDLLAEILIKKVKNVQMAAVALALFAGVISAFVDNVATVLMIAPVALQICKKLNTNPVPFIIGIAVSSNLQGAATLVGDTTAIMLGGEAGMSFLDFFWYEGLGICKDLRGSVYSRSGRWGDRRISFFALGTLWDDARSHLQRGHNCGLQVRRASS